MPMITADDGCPIYVELEGRDGAPVLMLSNSLGTNLHMWDDQASEFAKHFRLVRYDRRGHGQSVGANAPDRIEKLVLSNTNSYYPDKSPWNDRIKFVTEKGLAEMVDTNMQRWF